MMTMAERAPRRRGTMNVVLIVLATVSFALLIALGTWQVERLQWKEGLLATIADRISSEPRPLTDIQTRLTTTGDIEYLPVAVRGLLRHEGERHFFATHRGQSGYYVYTPLELSSERFVFVNRGFVPFDRKDPSMRAAGQIDGTVDIVGLARNRLDAKPSFIVPDNDPAGNVFYWKDLDAMAASSGVGDPSQYLAFFIDADDTPNPGGLPDGGVTIIDMPNNHLQYAVTWYGLAAALAGVMAVWGWRAYAGRGS